MRLQPFLFLPLYFLALGLQAQTPSISGYTSDTLDAYAETFDGFFKPIATINVAAQDVLTTFDGVQYVSWFNSDHRLCLARKTSGQSNWEKIVFSDYLKTSTDSHNGIAIGICPNDATIHLAFDNHNDTLNYRYSVPGLATGISSSSWDESSFLPVQHHLKLGVNFTDRFTYPRFLSTPDGNLLLHYRSFVSEINNRLAMYDGTVGNWIDDWKIVSGSGTFIDTSYGSSNSRRMYDNHLAYDDFGTLTTTFTWRENDIPEGLPSYNHDIAFMYSEDNGITWKNNRNVEVTNKDIGVYANIDSPDITVLEIPPAYAMINDQGHTIDPKGGVHAVMNQADEPLENYGFLGDAYYRHHWRKADGTWLSRELSIRGQRPRLICDDFANLFLLYTHSGTFNIATASPTDDYGDWKVIFSELSDFSNYFAVDNILFQDSGRLSLLAQTYPDVLGHPTPIYVMDFDLNYTQLHCSNTNEGCPAITVELSPNDDTYTRGGTYANDVLGIDKIKILGAKYAENNGGKHAVTYLRYNLSDYTRSGNLIKATLRMHVKKVVGSQWESDEYELWRCAHNYWTESSLTNNSFLKPSLTDSIGYTHADSDFMDWDLTNLMKGELIADEWLSLGIVGAETASGHVVFHSKESSYTDQHPQLILEFATSTISPTDDAYVRGGTYADDNFGDSWEMVIKEDGNSSYDRIAYLKFSVSAYTGIPVRQVSLHLDKKAMSPKAYLTPYAAYEIGDDTWSESTLTYSNKPIIDSPILSAHYGRDAMRWDVTSAFNQAKEGDGTMSVALKSLLEGAERNVNIYTKEFPDSTFHPRLIVLYEQDMPTSQQIPATYFVTESVASFGGGSGDGNQPHVYPNPTQNFFRVVMPSNEPATLQILSSTGTVLGVYNLEEASEQIFSLAQFPTGLYFIRIMVENGKNAWTVKLIRY